MSEMRVPGPRDFPLDRLEMRKEALMQDISKERNRPTVKRRRRLAAILVPAALLSVAATGYAVLRADEVVAAGIGCYSEVSTTDSGVTVVEATGADPVAVCRDLWSKGDIDGSSQVPGLTACINEEGAVSVFPTDDDGACAEMGLQPLPDGYRAAARAFVKMRDDVYRQLYEAGLASAGSESQICHDEDTALEIVEDVLSSHGFTDWTAEIRRGDYGDRTCMNEVAFEDVDKKVLIIPTEPGMIPWHKNPTM